MNSSDTVIAVVAGAFQNTIDKALESVRAVQAGRGPIPEEWHPFLPDPTSFTFVGGPEHRAIQAHFPQASWVFLSHNHKSEAASAVAQLLQRCIDSRRRVLVLGFHTEIFSLAKAHWPGIQVKAQHFFSDGRAGVSTVARVPVAFPVDAAEPSWTFGHLSTLEEALATLTQVLVQKGALSANRPIRQTQLRPLMGQSNSKFFGSAATTNSSGMIAMLLLVAAMRGMVELAGDPGDYLVWMKSRDSKVAESIAPASSTEPSPAPITVVAPIQEARAATQQQASFREDRRSRQPEKYRSDLYSESIGKARMGPFPVVRPKLYSALDSLASSNPKLSLSALVEAAIDRIRPDVPAGQPWEAIRNVTQRQLLKAQVALDESGAPLPERWQSGGRIVHGLADGWRVRAEAEILMALFEAENVTGNDIANVCRSVWGSRSSEAQAAFFSTMEYLTDTARVVEEDKSGVFRVKRLPSQGDDHPLPAVQPLERAASSTHEKATEGEPKDIVQ